MTGEAVARDGEEVDTFANRAFGFWIYLMTDLVLFAALFVTFAVLSRSYAGGPDGRALFDLPHVFVETMLLLSSSASYGMVMLAVHRGARGAAMAWISSSWRCTSFTA